MNTPPTPQPVPLVNAEPYCTLIRQMIRKKLRREHPGRNLTFKVAVEITVTEDHDQPDPIKN